MNAPLRRGEHIDWAVNSLVLFETDMVYAVEEDPSRFFFHDENGLRFANFSEGMRIERESLYRDTGVLYCCHKRSLNRWNDADLRRGHITLLPSESIRINSDFEFRLSELVLQGAFE